jgi:hypothetical protein
MTDRSEQIASFWEWFVEQDASLSQVNTHRDPALDGLLSSLQRIDPSLFFELCSNATPHEFILTVQGDSSKYALADAVIAAAPTLENWVFSALKPPMGFGFRTEYDGFVLDPATMWFLPMESPSNPTSIGLRIGIPDLDIDRLLDARNACLVVLDTALGERTVSTEIGHVEVVSLPPDPANKGYIELNELGSYLEWKKRKQNPAR